MDERRRSQLMLERWNLACWWAVMYFGARMVGWMRDTVGQYV